MEDYMLNLRTFYLNNIKNISPYNKYRKDILNEDFEILIYDDINEAIQEFKELVQPDNENVYSDKLYFRKFILICFYLNYHGYYIVQFPNFLSHPTTLSEFAYNNIRSHLITEGKSDNGTVRWAERRLLINELEFEPKDKFSTDFSESIEQKFQEISTRGATFDSMSSPEKLKEIANYLENHLKLERKFQPINEKQLLNLISNDTVKKYRGILQCYRHSSNQSLVERSKLKGNEKFLISFGIAIINGLHDN